MKKTCSTCRYWAGDENAYTANCTNPYNATSRPAFDDRCPLWAARPEAGGTTGVTQSMIDQWTAYKQAITKGRNTP